MNKATTRENPEHIQRFVSMHPRDIYREIELSGCTCGECYPCFIRRVLRAYRVGQFICRSPDVPSVDWGTIGWCKWILQNGSLTL